MMSAINSRVKKSSPPITSVYRRRMYKALAGCTRGGVATSHGGRTPMRASTMAAPTMVRHHLGPDHAKLVDEPRQQRHVSPLEDRWIGYDFATASRLEPIEPAPVAAAGPGDRASARTWYRLRILLRHAPQVIGVATRFAGPALDLKLEEERGSVCPMLGGGSAVQVDGFHAERPAITTAARAPSSILANSRRASLPKKLRKSW